MNVFTDCRSVPVNEPNASRHASFWAGLSGHEIPLERPRELAGLIESFLAGLAATASRR